MTMILTYYKQLGTPRLPKRGPAAPLARTGVMSLTSPLAPLQKSGECLRPRIRSADWYVGGQKILVTIANLGLNNFVI